MPAVSKAQQRFMGAELARSERGEKTQTGMSQSQLRDFASTKRTGLPEKSPSPHKRNKKKRRLYAGG